MAYDDDRPLDVRLSEVNRYLQVGFQDDALCQWVLKEMRAKGLPEINIGPTQGRLIHLLARMIGAKRILEIGTLGGYSGLWLARALPEDGELVTLEHNPDHAAVAEETFRRAGVHQQVRLMVGPAMDSLRDLAKTTEERPFDLAFLDADKAGNQAYLDWLLQGRRVRQNGVILIDNTLQQGNVLDPPPGTSSVHMSKFNQRLMSRHAFNAMILPFVDRGLDGMAILVVP